MDTLYCYRLDKKGIKKYEISEYSSSMDSFRRQSYNVFARLGSKTPNYHNVKLRNIDRFHQGFLFTFTLSDKEAKKIILDATKKKLEKAHKEVDRLEELYEKASSYLQ